MANLKIELPKEVLDIIQTFKKNSFEIYIVGGAVRDILMGKEVYDWDFTTNATPQETLKLFPSAFYDNKFGTVGIKPQKEGDRPFEITTFRKEEGYSDSRHPDKITWGKTLNEDLSRREATISAMALKPAKSNEYEIIDPYQGQKDIKKRIFKAVGDPNQRYQEDALRMIRAIRISAQLGFQIETKTFEAIKLNASLIHKIAKERIKDELFKILASAFPYEGMLLFKNVGLMEQILPEMEKTFGVEQKSPGRHHVYDVGTHLMLSLKFCKSEDPIARFATLIHDVGKPVTYKELENGTITFYNHEMVSTNLAKRISQRLKLSSKEKNKLITLVRYHQFTVDERQTDSAIRRFIRNVGTEYIPDMLTLRVADRLGGGARETSWRLEEFKKRLIEVQKQPFSIKDLKINGNDVMKTLKIPPGPKVGEILETIFEEVVEKKIENEKDILLKRLKDLS